MNAVRFCWTSASSCDVGLVRRINEDACLDSPGNGLWAVADGMGGHSHGELASRMVVGALACVVRPAAMDDFIAAVRQQLLTVNASLRLQAEVQDVQLIGSTVVALLVIESECAILWAGDSRAYLLRPGGLRQLTRDHSLSAQLVPAGAGAGAGAGDSNVLPAAARDTRIRPPANGITRAIGAAELREIDELRFTAQDGDVILLCSDGLTRHVSDTEIAGMLIPGNCRHAAQSLIALALQQGGRDNVSVVVATMEDLWSADRTLLNPAC